MRRLEQKEDIQTVVQHAELFSASVVMKEIQRKTTLKHHFTTTWIVRTIQNKY